MRLISEASWTDWARADGDMPGFDCEGVYLAGCRSGRAFRIRRVAFVMRAGLVLLWRVLTS